MMSPFYDHQQSLLGRPSYFQPLLDLELPKNGPVTSELLPETAFKTLKTEPDPSTEQRDLIND